MTTPRDLIAASSPSYPGLMLGHADEILQRLKDAGYVVVKLEDPAVIERLVLELHDQTCGGTFKQGAPWGCMRPAHRETYERSAAAVLAALGEPEAKEAGK